MKRLYGNLKGLKASYIQSLKRYLRINVPPEFLVTPEIVQDISRLSSELRRQIGLLIDRRGNIVCVIIGDYKGIVIPDTDEFRSAPGRLLGLRCIHTHLNNEALTMDDLNDLVLLKLDMMAAITVSDKGLPLEIHAAYILPENSEKKPCQIMPPLKPGNLDIGCLSIIRSLETEFSRTASLYDADSGKERAILISVTTAPKSSASESLMELEALADSCGINVVGKLFQQQKKINPKFILGAGKLQELTLMALQKGVTLIIFNRNLNPSQIRSITDRIDLKIIDRTQLILDIFAQRAQTMEGKLQVELAQLKYLLPRLVLKNTAMSRLTGGIGGRGPGETKLEINRRRARDRISSLNKAIKKIKKQRKLQRARREKKRLPVISIIGYTNAGKSTLLNTLTDSIVKTQNRLFETLDPSSRRLRFPEDMEVIITDTVGFIKDLPEDLMSAFSATLEELENADLLLHVIDISNPFFNDQIKSVETILARLNLTKIPAIRVLNKQDMLDAETGKIYVDKLKGILISARDKSTLMPLIKKMHSIILLK